MLTSVVDVSNHTKCLSLNYQQYMSKLTLIDLNPNGYIQRFCYYPFTVNLDRCVGSCNTFNDLYNRVCVPNKREVLNLSIFNMSTG